MKKGFTLIELLVVIAILGILASIIIATTGAARLRALDSQRKQNKDAILQALNAYRADVGRYPNTGGQWHCLGPSTYVCYNSLHTGDDTLANMLKPYISAFPLTNAVPGTYAFNSFKYDGEPTGESWLLWPSQYEITTLECPSNPACGFDGVTGGCIDHSLDSVYVYCWQYLAP